MLKRILIVDDSKIVRRSVRNCLEERLEHIVCSEAVDGLDAIERAKELKPDLVVLDFCMPRINGMQAAEMLREMYPRVPVILYTSHADTVLKARAEAVGVRAVVSKMESVNVLLGEVLNFVGVAKTASA